MPTAALRSCVAVRTAGLAAVLAPACASLHGRFEPRYAQEPVPPAPVGDPVGQPPAEGQGGSLQELIEILERAGAKPLEEAAQPPGQEPTPPAETGDQRTGADSPAQAPAETPQAEKSTAENPYLAYGPRIVAHADGRITKPYPLPPQKGRKLLELMALYGEFPLQWSVLKKDEGPEKLIETRAGADKVEAILLEEWDIEYYQDLRAWPPPKPEEFKPHSLADWLVVTAAPAYLDEVEHFLNLFAASVPQIEIEASIVELTETDGFDYGVGPPAGKKLFDFPEGVLVDSFSSSFPNIEEASEALLTLGAVQDETAFNAVLEAVKTWENVAIDSRPKIAVREGGRAEIISTQEIPFFGLSAITSTGGFNAQLAFKEVGIKLYVVPRVVGTDTLALNIDIETGSQLGTAVAFEQAATTTSGGETVGGQTISVPVIAKRGARTVVYLEPGQALILGGLTTTRDAVQEQKVPVLGDLPLLGYLFKSKATRREKNHVLFFIRPRILGGLDLQRSF